jgi:hypothetical protein
MFLRRHRYSKFMDLSDFSDLVPIYREALTHLML